MKREMSGQAKRDRAVLAAVERGKAANGLEYDYQAAALIGLDKGSYSRYKATAFGAMPFRTVAELARALGVTDREWCEMAGIKYG